MIDTHVHFRSAMSLDDMAGLVERAGTAGVERIVAVGCEPEANAAALRAAAAFPGIIKAAVGYDRSQAGSGARTDDLGLLVRRAPAGHVAAIGEIGLDFHYSADTSGPQQTLMDSQLALARELQLPVIVHSREADRETLDLLTRHARAWRGEPDRVGVLHCYTGTADMAKRLLDLGLMISFSGIVTFRNADALREVAREIPSDRLLIETDTPYLTPVPYRGKPNEPCYLPAVAAVLAHVRGIALDELAGITRVNACRLFAGLG